ncbi:MAG: hypothetical protein CMH57_15550 [Myxococcales bacterium]|nr:hypothetical protein [Myxococcales bacterium]
MTLPTPPRLDARWLHLAALLLTLCALHRVADAQSDARWPEPFPALEGQEQRPEDAAVIVGVEDYVFVADVPGAVANANDWYVYLRRVRGVPRGNMVLLRNQEATREGLTDALKEATDRVGPGGTLWFIFVGHGAPSEDGSDGVLIGADAQQNPRSLYARSLTRAEVLAALGQGPQQQTVVLLDACFNGRGADGSVLIPGLQPLLPVAEKVEGQDSALILSAGGADQFAGPLPRLDRPAFSYLMIGALRGWADANGDQQVTAAEALDYARDTLRVMVKDRQQDPQRVLGSGSRVLSQGEMEAGPDLDAIILAPNQPNVLGGLGASVTVNQAGAPPNIAQAGLIRFSIGPTLLGTGVFSGHELIGGSVSLGDQSAFVTPKLGNMNETAQAWSGSLWFAGVNEGFGFSTGLDFLWSRDLESTILIYADDELDADEAALEASVRQGRDYELQSVFMVGTQLEPHYRLKFGSFAAAFQTGVGFYLGSLSIKGIKEEENSTALNFLEFDESVFSFWLTWPVRATVEYEVTDNVGVGLMYSFFIYPSNIQQLQTGVTLGF